MDRPVQQRIPSLQDELLAWYQRVPLVTRFLFTSLVTVTFTGNFILSPWDVWYESSDIFKLPFPEVWRLFTSFFIQMVGLHLVFQLYFLHRFSSLLETGKFMGRTADYVYFVVIAMSAILVIVTIADLLVPAYKVRLLNMPLVMAIAYVWSQYNREDEVLFLFGLRFRGLYLPYVLLVYECLLRNGKIPWDVITGFFAGHIYYYLEDLYPATGGPRFIRTPQFLLDRFSQARTSTQASFGTVYQQRNPTQRPQQETAVRGHNWGRGQRLGN